MGDLQEMCLSDIYAKCSHVPFRPARRLSASCMVERPWSCSWGAIVLSRDLRDLVRIHSSTRCITNKKNKTGSSESRDTHKIGVWAPTLQYMDSVHHAGVGKKFRQVFRWSEFDTLPVCKTCEKKVFYWRQGTGACKRDFPLSLGR